MATIKFNSNKFKRDLEKAIKSETQKAIQNHSYELVCPNCKRKFRVRPGSSSCPYCRQIIHLNIR